MTIGNFSGEYKFVTPKGNKDVQIAYVPDFSDNYAMGLEVATALVDKMSDELLQQVNAVVVPGDKANMLGTLLYQRISNKRTDLGYGDTVFVILRSSEKGLVADSVDYGSITGGNKSLKIRPDQLERLRGKKIMLFDDVISSGGTIKAAQKLTERHGSTVIAVSCVGTEDVPRSTFEGLPLLSLTHFPVLKK